MQNLTFCPKYSIKNNCLTPNSLTSNFISLLATLSMTSMFAFRMYMFYLINIHVNMISLFISQLTCIIYCIGFFMNFIAGVLLTNHNITLVLTIQSVHRFLNNKIKFERFITWNWISGFAIFSLYIIAVTYFSIMLNLPFQSIFCIILVICFDINQIYAIRVMKLFHTKVGLWIDNALNLKIWKREIKMPIAKVCFMLTMKY